MTSLLPGMASLAIILPLAARALSYPGLDLGFIFLCSFVAALVNMHVLAPYMDEIFHVSQAQAFCLGDWQAWDPALTTPPGLYLIPVGVSRLLELLGFQRRCIDLAFLRNTNVILLTLLPTLVRSIAWNLHSEPATAQADDAAKQSSAQNGSSAYWLVAPALSEEFQWALSIRAYAIVSLPILWFFGFLFYTDVGSLFAVLMCYWLAQRGWLYPSALAGLCSLLFRQTNIIWVAFIMCTTLLRALSQANFLVDRSASNTTIGDVAQDVRTLAGLLTSGPAVRLILRRTLPFAPVFASFAAFLVWNGGIVLGDKANHVATIHLVQPFYFLAASTLFAWPTLLLSGNSLAANLTATARSLVGTPRRILSTALALALITLVIHRYTIFHPFVLADNRHYTFYLRRRILDVHPVARYAFAPVYLFCGMLWWHKLAPRSSWLWLLGFAGCTALVLVPSPLIEPRYFVVPYVLMRLQVPFFAAEAERKPDVEAAEGSDKPGTKETVERAKPLPVQISSDLIELVWCMAINAVTMWIFLYEDFYSPGYREPQRFMW